MLTLNLRHSFRVYWVMVTFYHCFFLFFLFFFLSAFCFFFSFLAAFFFSFSAFFLALLAFLSPLPLLFLPPLFLPLLLGPKFSWWASAAEKGLETQVSDCWTIWNWSLTVLYPWFTDQGSATLEPFLAYSSPAWFSWYNNRNKTFWFDSKQKCSIMSYSDDIRAVLKRHPHLR